jgi:aspartyl-tRNA(Asn)/glutamyl-tRNA(Gln) amidotransferase subunit A
MKGTIDAVLAALDSGATTSEQLVESCLARATASEGEGSRAFVSLFAEQALAEAEAIDRRRRAGLWTGPLGGIPISIKDLFDVRGMPTTAGSRMLADSTPALSDAVIVTRLRAAGAVIIGRTNMTEFAFSGLGLNPHYGTPAGPFDRAARRIPGGSSSGAAVSVSDGMSVAAVGTDTGGSVRIPAALCGLVGFKPTAARVPLAGALPLSGSLDSIGPIGRTVRCCRSIDAVLSGQTSKPTPPVELQGFRLAVPTDRVFDDIDPYVKRTFDKAISGLHGAGVQVTRIPFPEFVAVGKTTETATFPAVEGFAWHRDLLRSAKDRYDPRVATRLDRGRTVSAADYLWLLNRRKELIGEARLRARPFDAIAMPTVPIVAPTIAELEQDDAAYHQANLLVLRNPTLINFLDGCALSLPCHRADEAPVGFMLARFDGSDDLVLAMGEAIEAVLAENGSRNQ